MQVVIINKRYTFKEDSENGKIIFSMTLEPYPTCCLMAIMSNFNGNSTLIKQHNQQIEEYLLELMEDTGYNQVLVADTKNGYGYKLVSTMETCLPLGGNFNKNSGNFVYLLSIYQA